MKDFYEIATLIRKFRAHSLTREEVQELQKWLNEKGSRETFQRLMDGKREVEVMRDLRRYNTQEAYRKFTRAIRQKQWTIRRVMRVAAMFVFPMVLGALIYWWTGNDKRPVDLSLAQSTSLMPGQKKAVLTLENGMIMTLGDAMQKEIVTMEGVRLDIDSSGLSYKADNFREDAKTNELFVPRKGEYNLTLSDGTRVFLNSDSRLIYPVAFGKDKREVILEGEGYFDVVKDAARPFLVKTDDMTVQVLGTAFNVKCYAGEGRTEATLVRGSVNVLSGNRELLLVPGEQARYDRESGQMEKLRVNTALFTSWKDGLFVFERQRLEDILTILSRWYDVTVFYRRASLKEELFTGDLKKYESINEHLKMLEMTTDVRFEIHENMIIVK